MTHRIAMGIAVLGGLWVSPAPAQAPADLRSAEFHNGRFPAPDAGAQAIRKELRSAEKQMIAMNLKLSDAEAVKFWPVFDRYAGEMAEILDRKIAAMREYAQEHDTLTNEQTEWLLSERAEAEEAAMRVRLHYLPLFRNVLTIKSTALFYQLEWRFHLMVDVQLASQLPLIEN